MIFQITGYSTIVNYVDKRSSDVTANILDISLIQKELGWKPEVDLKAGIAKVWAINAAAILNTISI